MHYYHWNYYHKMSMNSENNQFMDIKNLLEIWYHYLGYMIVLKTLWLKRITTCDMDIENNESQISRYKILVKWNLRNFNKESLCKKDLIFSLSLLANNLFLVCEFASGKGKTSKIVEFKHVFDYQILKRDSKKKWSGQYDSCLKSVESNEEPCYGRIGLIFQNFSSCF